jgi:hypothetical protein
MDVDFARDPAPFPGLQVAAVRFIKPPVTLPMLLEQMSRVR